MKILETNDDNVLTQNQVENKLAPAKKVTNKLYYETVPTKLQITTWLWQKEQNHRLFNFSEGYKVRDKVETIVGSAIVTKDIENQNVIFNKPSQLDDFNENLATIGGDS